MIKRIHYMEINKFLQTLFKEFMKIHLTHVCDAVTYSSKQLQSSTVAVNDCMRNFFGFNRWESMQFLRLSFCYPEVIDIFASRVLTFFAKLPIIGYPTLKKLSELVPT